MSSSVEHTHGVPVEHLDYSYIGKCKDAKHLEKILRELRSGKEGFYPHLIKFCESHLEKLNPRSRALRRENPAATAASLSKDEWNQIVSEMKTWEEKIKKSEASLKNHPVCDGSATPVRGSSCFIPLNKKLIPEEERSTPEYPEWMMAEVDAALMSQDQTLLLANGEEDDESFREKDFEEAAAYCSRSLSALPSVASFQSRAEAQIKRWNGAMTDCQHMSELEPGSKDEEASEDLRAVLQDEPQNTAAAQRLLKIQKKVTECQPELRRRGIFIHEAEEEDDNSSQEKQHSARPVQPSQPVGGEERSVAPAVRGDMGNSQKKPHGRGSGGPPSEPGSSPHGGWKSKGGSADKYRVPPESKLTNGSSKGSESQQREPGSGTPAENGGDAVNLDAPCGALPPPLARLKNEGNLFYKKGQFADALDKYSQAIQGYADSGIDSPEDLCILYSNRAACFLKDGNSQDCIEDCTRVLELQPFSLKPLLRRAMAYESLERYRKAYVDYKTVMQIDISVQAAQDGVSRITRMLIEQDGPEWREKLPEIPLVPLSAQQHRKADPASAEVRQARAEKAARDAEKRAEILFSASKQEGNDFVNKAQYQDAVRKYTECLKIKPDQCAVYTNRALCYLKQEMFTEAKQDCDAALRLEPANKKAFYRRALANKGLKDYPACSSDLQEVLRLDPSVQEAQKELEEVTVLLKQSSDAAQNKPRKTVPIIEVDTEEAVTDAPNTASSCTVSINLHYSSPFEFGQALYAARCSKNTAACAELLASIAPQSLPQYLSNQLDGHTISFIMQALDSHLLEKDPNLVYQHLNQLHTADRFSTALRLMDKRDHMMQLFERLSGVESTEFNKNDVQNLANKYI
ncbi:sperm-associated antigen 1 isoform X1 [Oryzias melastigma]|uniref:sperm-associated antigen 1 isoform X1 n=2 Tax=Oryzias melastigma TaxID=30732 RepID=UPI000CF7FE8B|nr:sperm-associated antigen 1 isoform X1 [Oryzias melastigma]